MKIQKMQFVEKALSLNVKKDRFMGLVGISFGALYGNSPPCQCVPTQLFAGVDKGTTPLSQQIDNLIANDYNFSEKDFKLQKISLIGNKNLSKVCGNGSRSRCLAKVTVGKNGENLKILSKRWNDDFQFVREAVIENPDTLQYLDKKHKTDKRIVDAAVKVDGLALKHAKDYMTSHIVYHKNSLYSAHQYKHPLRDLFDTAIKAVTNNGLALEHVVKSLLASFPKITLEAVKQNGLAIESAALFLEHKNIEGIPTYSNDWKEQIVFAALKQNPASYEYLPKWLKDHKDVAVAVVKSDGLSLAKLPDRFKDDIAVVQEAMKQNPRALEAATKRVKNLILEEQEKRTLAEQTIFGRVAEYAYAWFKW